MGSSNGRALGTKPALNHRHFREWTRIRYLWALGTISFLQAALVIFTAVSVVTGNKTWIYLALWEVPKVFMLLMVVGFCSVLAGGLTQKISITEIPSLIERLFRRFGMWFLIFGAVECCLFIVWSFFIGGAIFPGPS